MNQHSHQLARYLGRKNPRALLALAAAAGGVVSLFKSEFAVAAVTTHTLTSTGANSWTSAGWTNGAPTNTTGDVAMYNTASTASTTTLDSGAVVTGQLLNANSGAWTVNTGTGTLLTFNNTNGTSNAVFTTDSVNPFIGTTSSGSLTFNPNIVIASGQTLNVGKSSTGAVVINGSITGSVSNSIVIKNTSSTNGVTFGAASTTSTLNVVGTITDNSTASSLTVINSIIGSSVTGVIQNNANTSSSLVITGDNASFGGTVTVNAGRLDAQNLNNTNILRAMGISNVQLNSGTLDLRANGNGSGQTIITGNGTTGNNVNVGGNTTIDAQRINGNTTGNTFQLNALSIGAYTLNITGTNTYGVKFTGTTTMSGNVVFNPTTANLTLGNVVESGGSGRTLTKNGAGVLVMSGTSSYTGLTTVNGGVLRLSAVNALPGGINATGGSSALTLNGGVIELANGNFLRNLGATSSTFQITGGASGFSAFNSGRTVNINNDAHLITWGSATFNPSTLVLNETTANNTLTFANPIDLNNTASTATRTINVNANTATINVALSSSGSGVTQLSKGGGGTLVLGATNTFTGNTTITGGALNMQHVNALNSNASIGINVYGGAKLQLQGGITPPSKPLALNSNASASVATLESVSGTNAYNGTISMGGDSQILSSTAGYTFTLGYNAGATISGSGKLTFAGDGNTTVANDVGTSGSPLTGVYKTGAGTLNLGGSLYSSSSGTGLNVVQGTVVVNNASVLPTGNSQSATARSNGTLDLRNSVAVNSLTGAGTISSLNASGPITVTVGQGDANSVVSGKFTDTAGKEITLAKAGAGTTLLASPGDYKGGTNITAGTLKLADLSNPVSANLVYRMDAQDATSIQQSGGKVTQWNDLSGNSNDMLQGTVANQPVYTATSNINNKPAIRFASGTQLATAQTGTVTQSVVIVNASSATNAYNGIWGTTGQDQGIRESSNGSVFWSSIGSGANTNDYTVQAGSSMTINGVDTSNFVSANNPQILTAVRGAQYTHAQGTALGYKGAGRTYVGDVGEILVFNAALSDNQQQQLQAYLYAKWWGSQTDLIPDTSAVNVSDGATLDINGHTETIGSLTGSGNVILGSGALTVGADHTTPAAFSGSISGNGSFTKTGTGALTLSGSSNYSGPTIVSAGKLAINGSITSNTTIQNTATLGGTGSISGTVTIQSGGHLAPGNSPGALVINNTLTLDSGSVSDFEIASTSSYDRVTGLTGLSYGGTLNVTGSIASASHTYTLFSLSSGTPSGDFSSVNLATAPTGYRWHDFDAGAGVDYFNNASGTIQLELASGAAVKLSAVANALSGSLRSDTTDENDENGMNAVGSIHVTGSNGGFVSEIDGLTNEAGVHDFADGYVQVDNDLSPAPTLVMLWLKDNDGVGTGIEKSDVINYLAANAGGAYTVLTSSDAAWQKLAGAYSGFDTIIDFGSVMGTGDAFSWKFEGDYAAITVDKVAVVPEPGSLGLLGLGVMALMGSRRRKSKKVTGETVLSRFYTRGRSV